MSFVLEGAKDVDNLSPKSFKLEGAVDVTSDEKKGPGIGEKLESRATNVLKSIANPKNTILDTGTDFVKQTAGAYGDVEKSIASEVTPDILKRYGKDAGEYVADSRVGRIASSTANKMEKFGEEHPSIGKPASAVMGVIGAQAGGEGLASAGKYGVKAIDATSSASKAAGKSIADYVMKPPTDKGSAYIAKELKKAGHSPEEIVAITQKAKENGMTVGEASQNPAILGMERKISGLNKPGGETVRGFIKDRVDPQNNVSIPFKLKTIADPLVKATKDASAKIGKIVEVAPKNPIDMSKMEGDLASEKRLPGSRSDTTIRKMQGYFDWAKENGNSFANWHTVKQHLWDLKKEAADPTAVEKLDGKMINKYYRNINDTLAGKKPGILPKDLSQTSADYATQNRIFSENVAGRTIETTLSKIPEGGSPSQKLAFLHKKLAGSKELQEEIFGNMPVAQREGILKLLDQAKNISRVGANDIVKSGVEGTPSLPLSKTQVLGQLYDKVSDFVLRKDYNGLAKALTSPDVEKVAERLGYVKPEPIKEAPLRLTYQPKPSEMIVGRQGVKLATPAEQHANDAIRARMKRLGLDTSTLRVQDMNAMRAMEKKYGQSELGKFMAQNHNQPLMGRAWEVPQTEYSQATTDKMLNRGTMAKLDKAQKEEIRKSIEAKWNSHQTSVADIILQANKDAETLAKEIEQHFGKGAFPEDSPSHMQELMLKAAETATPLQNVTKDIK